MAYFTRKTFQFFKELNAHNERPWFEANKHRYIEHVRDPFLAFIRAVDKDLKKISPHYYGDDRTNGGSLFRIYRDVRFSKDKTPYKPWAGARFKHLDSGTQTAPTFYLHIQPGHNFMGCGIWHPPAPVMNGIREFIHNNPRSWQLFKNKKKFRETFNFGGDSLKRPPRGFPKDDPLIEDLKRKDFVVSTQLTNQQVLADDFNKTFIQHCKIAAPMVDYLCAALDLEF